MVEPLHVTVGQDITGRLDGLSRNTSVAAISRPSLSWSHTSPGRTVLNLARRNVDHQLGELGGIAGRLGRVVMT